MKAKALLLFVSFVCAPALYSFGQVNCLTSTKLVCQFPFNAQSLGEFAGGSQGLTALAAEAQVVAKPINASIATQLAQLPIPSATVGIVSLRKKGSDVGVPFQNLGPVLTDRPDTVGKGHLFAGFSYQHFNFTSLDGQSLSNLPMGFSYSNAGNTVQFFDSLKNNVSFQLDQYVALVTYGFTKRTDVSLVVPFNSVNLAVTTSGFTGYQYTNATQTYGQVVPAQSTVVTGGSASGVGDVTVIVKQMLIGGDGSRGAVAAGASLRFHNGDALNYMGSGAYGGNVYGLFEYRARVAPHVKVSYQNNGTSQVMDLTKNSYLRLPGGLQYDAGFDTKVNRHLTLAIDFLGNQFDNAPAFNVNPTGTVLPLGPGGTAAPVQSMVSITPLNSTYSTINFSGGVKWSPFPHFLIYGNVLTQLNNVGLKSNPVPLVGIAYNFKAH